jgi:hypothetical protein
MTDTTTAAGAYWIAVPGKNTYNLQAQHCAHGSSALISGVSVFNTDTISVPAARLARSGALRVSLPDSMNAFDAYVYIPGTTLFAPLHSGSVLIPEVPAGFIPAVYYARMSSSGLTVIRTNITVASNDTAAIFDNSVWTYSRQLFLNTTSSGANVSGNVPDFPLLVRLTGSTFSFSQTKKSGADLRFTASNGSPLAFEIEQWDSANAQAAVWVRLDTIYGNNSTQYITMCWGNPDAAAASNSAAVFDTAAGYQGVWHLGEGGDAMATDATANRYDGTPYGMSAASAVAGAIGSCRSFDGITSSIIMLNTARGMLDFSPASAYTVSAWVYVASQNNSFGVIAGKGHGQYYVRMKNSSSAAVWEISDYHENVGWQQVRDTLPPQTGAWKYVTAVHTGSTQKFYMDGNITDSLVRLDARNLVSADRSQDVALGAFVQYVANEGFCFFNGRIDEVRMASAAHSPDFIRLCYMNQKAADRLIIIK